MTHDVIIIGGGSAGYAAARTARDAGADVAIIDHGPLGGLCILRGCMPTKTILRSSDVIAVMRRAREFGLKPAVTTADLAAIIDRKDRLVREFAEDRIRELHDTRFTLYQKRATFRSTHEVQAGDQLLKAKAFVIATGSLPARLPIHGLEAAGYVTSDEVLDLRQMPSSLLVLGGGPVAVELAQFYARIGVTVTMIQRSHQLLSHMDEDLARVVEARFREEGIRIHTGAQLQRFTTDATMKTAHFSEDGRRDASASAELILQALGRRPNVDRLNLETAHVRTEEGRIVSNDEMRTSQAHIFAVGDVSSLLDIVHIAIQQGEIAGYNATHPDQPPRRMDDRLKTEVVYSDPQVATVGLSERECRAQGVPYLVASYPFNDHGKAMTLGETHGHVKLLCRPETGELIGAHIVGPEASELIHEMIAVMYYCGTAQDLLHMPHYHPTLAEIVTYPAESLVEQLA